MTDLPDHLKDKIRSIIDLPEIPNFRAYISQSLTSRSLSGLPTHVLDIGTSSRAYRTRIEHMSTSYISADLNPYPGIDLLFDICDSSTIPSHLYSSFTDIIALAILEHVYNPFDAAKNLALLVDKSRSPRIWLYVPFLLESHFPKDLSYQDYFRFTRDSFAALFPDSKQISVSPCRGPFSTAFSLCCPIYKHFSKNIPYNLLHPLDLLYSKHKRIFNVSGYNAIIEY